MNKSEIFTVTCLNICKRLYEFEICIYCWIVMSHLKSLNILMYPQHHLYVIDLFFCFDAHFSITK